MINNDTAVGSCLAAIGLGGITVQQLTAYANTFTIWANAILAVAGLVMLGLKVYRLYRKEK